MTVLQAIILGAIQGLTEFLPVSSSGHLVIAQDIFGIRLPGLTFEIMVHGGTLLAVLVVFNGRIQQLLHAAWCTVRWGALDAADRNATRMLFVLALASVPAALVGLGMRVYIERLFASPNYTAVGLFITGGLLLSAGLKGRTGTAFDRIRPLPGFIIGCFQALAIAPGISRSGSTITAGLWLGLSRQASAEFSFLLSIPAILGALLVDLSALDFQQSAVGADVLLAGTASAAVFGYIAIKVLLRFLHTGRYHLFAYYVWGVGLLVLISQAR